MKNSLKKFIVLTLRALTSAYLKKNKIKVIAITGSAGKTTTKYAIAQLLADTETYVSTEDYNTEIGLPLTVFKEKIPENVFSFSSWLRILARMLKKLFFQKADYRRVVLEMGADQPGDISYLTSFAKPQISVVTTVLPVHLENFKNIEAVAEEKSQILKPLKENNVAILNYDDKNVREMAKMTKSQIIWVGLDKKADLHVDNLKVSLSGLSFNLYWKDKKESLDLQIIAPQLVVSLLSALAVCLYLGEDLDTLIKRLEKFKSQNGRMNLLSGLNQSVIIDDSYNANPGSALAALETLAKLDGRKIAVLGSMNELGQYEKEGHQKVGHLAGQICDILVTVGTSAEKYLVPAAIKNMNKDVIQSFDNPYAAGQYLKTIVKAGDTILVKGSQNQVFTEETVKIILAEPEKASEFLVRQSDFWQKKKKKCFGKKYPH